GGGADGGDGPLYAPRPPGAGRRRVMSPGVRESLPFRITDVKEADLVGFLTKHRSRQEGPPGWRARVIWLLALLAVGFVMYASGQGWLGRFGQNLHWVAMGAVLGGAALIGLFRVLARVQSPSLRQQLEHPKNRWADGPWWVRLSGAGLTMASADVTHHH